MKKKTWLLILLSAAIFCTGCGKEEPEKEPEKKPEPLVIEISKEKNGVVQIYNDEELIYEYKGPLEVQTNGGTYYIKVKTESCSCVTRGAEDERKE